MGSDKDKRKKAVKFTDLEAWQYGHALAVDIYKVTKNWPKDEQYGLISQIRRAAVSVTSNLAEGFSRSTKSDKKHFYVMAHGSLTELQNQLLLSKDIGYLDNASLQKLAGKTVVVHKLITGLIKSLEVSK